MSFTLELEEEPAELEAAERQVRHADRAAHFTRAARAAAAEEEEEGNGAGPSGPTFVYPIIPKINLSYLTLTIVPWISTLDK